ncbi:MAG: hypothetical protein PHI28_16310, partial [Mangrovibacterium sp.]|nr:hypothetical protein [Mangrovibacterium sp.]
MIRVSLKNRLSIGFGFLLIMVVFLWITGTYFIYNLSSQSAAMLKENYQTVESTKFLIQAIDEIKNKQLTGLLKGKSGQSDTLFHAEYAIFLRNLEAVKNNVTEDGEAELIRKLEESFQAYLSTYDSLKENNLITPESLQLLIIAYSAARDHIVRLWDLNMKAISYKNSLVKNTFQRACVIMSLIGLICFVISALF